MNDAGKYRELFTWLDEHLKRLIGEAEDLDDGVLEALGEEETVRTGVVSLVRDNGIAWLRDGIYRLKEHILSMENDVDALFRLVLADKLEADVRDRLRRIREDEESLERSGKTEEWEEEED